MLMVPTFRASEGMTLALPVYHPGKPDHLLLKIGARLDAPMLQRLADLKVPRLWVRYPSLDLLAKYASPRILEQHAELTARLTECFDTVTAHAAAQVEFTRYIAAVRGLLDSLLEDAEAALLIWEMIDAEQPLLARASNICFLSLVMGLKLDSYLIDQRKAVSARRAKNIENLGVGAMLADVGLLRLEPEVLEHWHKTYDTDDRRWREHVLLGYEIVRGKIAPTAAAAVLHHHQRYDGLGFPRKRNHDGVPAAPKGAEIHIFSRIIAVADQFDMLRNPAGRPRDGGAVMPNVVVLRTMLDMARAGAIDPTIFKALLAVVPAYAPGSILKLSDGTVAVATGWDPLRPCRPRICRMRAERLDGRDLPLEDEIDLRTVDPAALHVIESEGHDVTTANFEPAEPHEFDLRIPTGEEVVTGLRKTA